MQEVIRATGNAAIQFHSPIVKHSMPRLRAKLHKFFHLSAKLSNNTRYISVHETLRCQAILRDAVLRLDVVYHGNFLLAASIKQKIDTKIQNLAELN